MTILGRNGDEDRFVKSATDDFNLATGDEFVEAMEIFGMRAFDPFEQGPGIVETEANRGMPREKFDKRQVAILVGAFDYVFEISNRLMGVNQRNEFEFPHRRTTSGSEQKDNLFGGKMQRSIWGLRAAGPREGELRWNLR